MKTQNKKAKVLRKRSDQVEKVFDDVVSKYAYSNLKAQSRRMLQPMLNEQQEFVRLKWLKNNKLQNPNAQLSYTKLPNRYSQESNDLNTDFSTEQDQQINEYQKETVNYKEKIKRAVKNVHNYSLNDIISREEKQKELENAEILKIEEEVSDSEILSNDEFEEYRGCSLTHSSKQVQQSLNYYEQTIKQNLKTLPQIQQNNVLIGRITSTDLVFQELKKAHQDKNYKIKSYLMEDFIEYQQMKKNQQKEELQNKIYQNQYNNQGFEDSKERNSPTLSTSFENNRFSTPLKQDNVKQTEIQDLYKKTYNQNNKNELLEKQSFANRNKNNPYFNPKKVLTFQSEYYTDTSNNNDNYSTNFTKGNQDITQESIQRQGNSLDTTLNNTKSRNDNEFDDSIHNNPTQCNKNVARKIPNLSKMYKFFQLNKVINPLKLIQKDTAQDQFQNIIQKYQLEKYQLSDNVQQSKSLSRENSAMQLNSNSSKNNISRSSSSQHLKNVVLSPIDLNKKNKLLDSTALGIPYSQQNQNKKVRYNVQKEPEIPEFVQKLKNTMLEIEELGDKPLTHDQTIQLVNSMGLLSMHKDIINNTGKSVAEFVFDKSKEHFIVPQKNRKVRAYGSIAMLDRLFSVNLPSIYLMQGIGKMLDT